MNRIKLFCYILSTVFILYIGLFLYVKCVILKNLPPTYEKEDNFIFYYYYIDKKVYPENEILLKDYLKENYYYRFDGNQIVDYLLNFNFHIKYDTNNNVYFVYINGTDFKDDKLSKITDVENINFLNFLFAKGDVLLFYTKKANISDRKSLFLDDTSSEYGINLDSIR